MGKKHLSEDKIRYIVSAESSQAQKDIHELTKATKQLKKEEKERRAAMIELEAQGKKGTKEYQNLEKVCKSLSKQVSDNNKRIGELTRSLDINAMTGRQLKKVAKELAATLDDMSEAADPEEYAKLNNQLRAVRQRLAELKGTGQNVKSEFGAMETAMGKLKAIAVAFIAVKLAGYLKDIGKSSYTTRKEFAKYEAVLRNTLQSQEKAAAAMKMLQKLAADTPDSLAEWTEAYIKLINRGIKPTTTELTNMGDLAASQGKSVDQLIEAILDAMTGENERLKEFGIKASKDGDIVKYTFKGVTTEVKNSEEAIKDYLLSLGRMEGVAGSMSTQMQELQGIESNLGDTMDNFYNKLGKRLETYFKKGLKWANEFMSGLTKAIEPLSDTFEAQFEKVVELQSTLPVLTARYEELKGKTSLTKDEQDELNKVIERVTSIVPSATTEWNDYGEAIALNTTRVHEFLEAEMARLQYLHRGEIEQAQSDIDAAKKTMEEYQALIKNGGKWKTDRKSGEMFFIKWTAKELDEFNEKIKEAGKSLKGAEAQLNKWSGEDIKVKVNEKIEADKKKLEAQKRFNNMNKSMLSAWLKDEKNAADQYREIAQEVYNKRFLMTNSTSDKSDPNAVALKNLDSQHEAEINEIRLAGREKQQAEEDINSAILKSDQVYYNNRIKLLEQFKATATKSAKKADYQKQIVDAKSKLIDTEVSLEKQKVSAIEKLRQDDLEKEENSNQSALNAYKLLLQNKKISQEQYNILEVTAASNLADEVLRIETEYQDKMKNLTITNLELKEKAVKDAAKRVQQSEQDSFNKRLQAERTFQTNIEGIRGFIGEELSPEEELDKKLKIQLSVLELFYQSTLEYARQNGKDEIAITHLYNKAKYKLQEEYYAEKEELAKKSAKLLHGMSGNKLAGDVENLMNAISSIRTALKNINEPDFWKDFGDNILQNMKTAISATTKMLSSAFNTFKDVELNNIDEKYNAEIEAAEGNSDEIERLEKEKAQKKLNIEKKYADVQFAIKVSEIIASTGLSIMQAFAQLGPIGGAIAAAMLAATSSIQVTAANAERQKVKNMTLSGSSSSSKGSGQRVATGREDGGKIDVRRAQDGKLFAGADYDPDARGFIDKPTVIVGEGPTGQSKEWVASNAAVENPTVGPILDMIDKSQQAGTIRTLDLNQVIRSKMAGFSSGGSISQPMSFTETPKDSGGGVALPPELMEKFAKAVINMNENGVKAPVVLSDFEKKQALRDRSRQIGSKG